MQKAPIPVSARESVQFEAETLIKQTVRQIVHLSKGGDTIRIRLSNLYGSTPLVINSVSVSIRSSEASVIEESLRDVTFGTKPRAFIPAGSKLISDPVDLTVERGQDIAVSLYVENETFPTTWHAYAYQTSYISTEGDHTRTVDLPIQKLIGSWYWLSGIEVSAPKHHRAIVAFGDSITEGAFSTWDANSRYPDILAERLGAKGRRFSVLNVGIGGNELIAYYGDWGYGENALARLDRDAITHSGVTHVILQEGINDIRIAASALIYYGIDFEPEELADLLIFAYRQIINRLHTKNIKVIGGTLLPFAGYYLAIPKALETRQIVNNWIRTSQEFDAVIDFDVALRDPDNPESLRPEYDCGDHLHPNDLGYEAMANAIPLHLFHWHPFN